MPFTSAFRVGIVKNGVMRYNGLQGIEALDTVRVFRLWVSARVRGRHEYLFDVFLGNGIGFHLEQSFGTGASGQLAKLADHWLLVHNFFKIRTGPQP